MMKEKVIKTTFEGERKLKEEAWLKLAPAGRLAYMAKLRKRTRKPGVNYSYEGMRVRIKRTA